MAITETQRKERKNHLGSSDLPAILGFSRFATAYDVWMEKTNRIPYITEEKVEDWQEAGNILESSVIDWAQKKGYFKDVERDPEIAVPDTPIVVHIDAVERETGNPVEVKTEGLYGPLWNTWGEVGTDEIPEYAYIQAQTHLMATGKDVCHIPAFLGGRGFCYYYTERDEELQEIIREQALKFWNEYVLTDTPPYDSVPTLELAKKIRHVVGDPKELDPELVAILEEVDGRANHWSREKDKAKAAILAALDGRQEGVYGDPTRMVTHYEQKKTSFDSKQIKIDLPNVAEPYIRRGTNRVLRLKKVKP